MKYSEGKDMVIDIFSNKKFQWTASILLLAIVLIMSSSVRLSNWELLTDHTTGEKIPLALDPFYFLRMAETLVATDGNLPAFDSMRIPGINVPWHTEIMPQVVVLMWKMSGFFGFNYTIQEVDVFSPVFFYAIGLILFFILTYILTKSKTTSILASAFLALTPAYLYRTMAGFSDHEAIGMVGFFLTMIGFVLAVKYLDSVKKRKLVMSGLAGVIIGALGVLTTLFWGGVSVFIFMIFPIAFALLWVIRLKDEKNHIKNNGLVFYVSWLVSGPIFAIFSNIGFSPMIGKYTSTNGIISLAVLGFIIIDRIMIYAGKLIPKYKEKYRLYYSLGISIFAGALFLPILNKNLFSIIWTILNKLLNPAWGGDRVSSTVAENAQPYLVNWISNAGSKLFWLFVAGAMYIGIDFSKNIKSGKMRYLLISGFILMISGILFSRISSTSILNGDGIFTISGLAYLGGIAFFCYAFLLNYFNKKMDVDSSLFILFSWLIVMLVVGRSTTRLFFVIAPLMCLMAGYFISKMIDELRSGKLEEISRILVIGILIISVLAAGLSIYGSYASISNQAKYTGPSANYQWQSAMSWVRENTTEEGVFAHWWDYGYWVQTLGERATVADGGHAQGVYDGNFKIGRYVLTTPKPETALSFFKTMGVDYLLIDQTDLGKYPAYSKIGGGNDAEGKTNDRYSAIPVMPNDAKQTVETANGTTFVFSGGMYLFEDIIYNEDGKNIFLPEGKAAVVGIVLSVEENSLKQPEVVYIYNGVQTRIPARYVYLDGRIIDFGKGLDVVIDIIPAFTGSSINPMGAAIYLSQKVSKSLFARLYLMDDAFEEYGTLKVVHTEDDQVVAGLKAQGADFGDFIYYQGFRGPIKIWDVSNIPEGIKVVDEFWDAPVGEYGTLDDLDFGSSEVI